MAIEVDEDESVEDTSGGNDGDDGSTRGGDDDVDEGGCGDEAEEVFR